MTIDEQNLFRQLVADKESRQRNDRELDEGSGEGSEAAIFDQEDSEMPDNGQPSQRQGSDEGDLETAEDDLQSMLLPLEVRRALVYLMRHGAVFDQDKPHIYKILTQYEQEIRQHLANFCLQVIHDSQQKYLFLADYEGDTEEEEFPSLISKRTLSLYDTIILLILRKHYQERDRAGEAVIMIDFEKLLDELQPFIGLIANENLERKKVSGRLEEFAKRRLLQKASGTEGRYQITPIICYVVNSHFLTELLSAYEAIAQQADQKPGELDIVDVVDTVDTRNLDKRPIALKQSIFDIPEDIDNEEALIEIAPLKED
ncbi:DUF4194 domain-containing protein [Ignatzschineria ureiclastica]|nr:DUF4194 domain-containing protein [Ignatzschineria ureiclastica]